MATAALAMTRQAGSQTGQKSAGSHTNPKAADNQKREFISRANAEWEEANKKAEAQAKEDEKRGKFSSLSPPSQLVPFKDWDYYFTKGLPAIWSPNPGQPYKRVLVPQGFVTDLASIPQLLWSSGLRPEGPYAYAAIVHDYLYWMQDRTREEADDIFRFAMEDSKVEKNLKDKLYSAVKLLGKRAWDKNAQLKRNGEHRLLRKIPTDFTITWDYWKRQPGVFAD